MNKLQIGIYNIRTDVSDKKMHCSVGNYKNILW